MEASSILDPENIRKNTFRIGDFRVEPTRNLIVGGDQRFALEPMIMDVLCELASYPGEVIARFELIQRVWKVDYGADESLTRAISILRKTFRKGGATQKYIETISKNGYRLIAPVGVWTDGSTDTAPAKAPPPIPPQTTAVPKADLALSNISARITPIAEPSAEQRAEPRAVTTAQVSPPAPPAQQISQAGKPKPRRNQGLIFGGIFAVVLIGLSLRISGGGNNPAPNPALEAEITAPQRSNALFTDVELREQQATFVPAELITETNRYGRSVAVLSFTDMSADNDQQYFADGMAEEILEELTSLTGLRVVGRNASFAYKDKDISLRAIGDALRVSHVIDGSIRTQNEQVRVAVQLLDTGDMSQLWSRSYDGNLDNGLALQSEISRDIIDELQLILSFDNSDKPVFNLGGFTLTPDGTSPPATPVVTPPSAADLNAQEERIAEMLKKLELALAGQLESPVFEQSPDGARPADKD